MCNRHDPLQAAPASTGQEAAISCAICGKGDDKDAQLGTSLHQVNLKNTYQYNGARADHAGQELLRAGCKKANIGATGVFEWAVTKRLTTQPVIPSHRMRLAAGPQRQLAGH
jgi:hypothetical protein